MSSAPEPKDIRGAGIGEPAEFLQLITPSDTEYLKYTTRAIRVGGAGDLAVMTANGEVTTIPSLLAGETIVVRAKKVYSTNTTATEIMGMA